MQRMSIPPVLQAIIDGNVEILTHLVKSRSVPLDKGLVMPGTDGTERTILGWAIYFKKFNCVKAIINIGKAMNFKAEPYLLYRALKLAIQDKNQLATTQMLLDEKAAEGYDSEDDDTVYGVAAKAGNSTIIPLLTKYFSTELSAKHNRAPGSKERYVEGTRPIQLAAGRPHWECVKELAKLAAQLIKGQSNLSYLKKIDYYGLGYVLYEAYKAGRIDIMKIIFNSGIPKNYPNPQEEGGTYLHLTIGMDATDQKIKEMMVWLLLFGVNVNARNKQNRTAYEVAVSMGEKDLFNDCIDAYNQIIIPIIIALDTIILSRQQSLGFSQLPDAITLHVLSFISERPIITMQTLHCREHALTEASTKGLVKGLVTKFNLFKNHYAESEQLVRELSQHVNNDFDVTKNVKNTARQFAEKNHDKATWMVCNLRKYKLLPQPEETAQAATEFKPTGP